MNAVRIAGCAIVAVMLLGGCASMSDQPEAAVSAASAKPASYVVDSAYIDRVERAARRDNVEVHWVNPPAKRVTSSTESR